jgi:hypothetical protein
MLQDQIHAIHTGFRGLYLTILIHPRYKYIIPSQAFKDFSCHHDRSNLSVTGTQSTRSSWVSLAWNITRLGDDSAALVDDGCDLEMVCGGIRGFAQGYATDAVLDTHERGDFRVRAGKLLIERDLRGNGEMIRRL